TREGYARSLHLHIARSAIASRTGVNGHRAIHPQRWRGDGHGARVALTGRITRHAATAGDRDRLADRYIDLPALSRAVTTAIDLGLTAQGQAICIHDHAACLPSPAGHRAEPAIGNCNAGCRDGNAPSLTTTLGAGRYRAATQMHGVLRDHCDTSRRACPR